MNSQSRGDPIYILPTATYLGVYFLLLMLLGATVGVYCVDLGPTNTAAAILIAATKAALVAIFFMHIKYSSNFIRVVATAGLIWLAILMALTLNDYLTRGW